MKEPTEVIEAKVVKADKQAVMLTPEQLQTQMERDEKIRAIINQYIKNNMVEGKDYGTINIRGSVSKPSLFKPGAEKFCGLFKIRPTFRKDEETIAMLGDTPGIIAYICELVDTQGLVIGEGRGTAKTNPKEGSDFDINKQVKIAEKRAQIDAVLRTGGLSDFFTQDMEDMPHQEPDTQKPNTQLSLSEPPPASVKQIALIADLAQERFGDKHQFAEFCIDKVGKKDGFDVKEASLLINELFGMNRLESDEDYI